MDLASAIVAPYLREAEARCGFEPGTLGASGGPSSDRGGPAYENATIRILPLDGGPVAEPHRAILQAAADAAEPEVLCWGHAMRAAFAADAFHASFHDLRACAARNGPLSLPDPAMLDLREPISRLLWGRPRDWDGFCEMHAVLRPGIRDTSPRLLIHPVARYRSERPALALSEAATLALSTQLRRLQAAIAPLLAELVLVEVTWDVERPTAHQRMAAARRSGPGGAPSG